MLQIHYTTTSPDTTDHLTVDDHRALATLDALVAEVHPDGLAEVDSLPVHLILSDDDHLRRLNAQYRDRDEPTDVLSFDYRSEGVSPVPDVAPVLGEVYISLDRASQQAAERGIALIEEVARLTVHGLLHLAGRDHDTPESLHDMESETDTLLQRSGLLRQTGVSISASCK